MTIYIFSCEDAFNIHKLPLPLKISSYGHLKCLVLLLCLRLSICY